MPTFVLAGGGTGGHVFPGIAVALELRARGHSVRFIGTERGMESKLVPQAGFPFDRIEIGGLNRVGFRRMLQSLVELPSSIWQSSRLLARSKPAAVFSTGGYVAGPVLIAALWKRIPVVVMEPNAIPGFTHRKLSHFVARALVSFEESAKWFPEGRAELTGMPVREEFFSVPEKPPGKPLTVLITGGSQGSRTLNRAVEESWPLWPKDLVRLIHQTGRAAFEELAPRFRGAGVGGEVVAFVDDMAKMLAEADLVLCRSGMGTVSELAAAGKPAILVPLPTASDQHQLRNAEAFAKAGAGILVVDAEMTGGRLVEEVTRLVKNPGVLVEMGRSARKFVRQGAAHRAAEVLEEMVR
jgi:UDP-N-acetylglucosamine--N-acetylmuramyl-(pentapeptide) pyrophosphoryl-undecaprenol N-acetylglucosamine transferase